MMLEASGAVREIVTRGRVIKSPVRVTCAQAIAVQETHLRCFGSLKESGRQRQVAIEPLLALHRTLQGRCVRRGIGSRLEPPVVARGVPPRPADSPIHRRRRQRRPTSDAMDK
jgi:hypothetical protein